MARGSLGPRITGGTARGTKLFTVPGLDVRPALARMRVSVFEILKSRLDGARVVDLFAGTGTLGFEALSRGAKHCAFLDTDPRCVEAIGRNLKKLRLEGRAVVFPASAFDFPEAGESQPDIVFVDPPYSLYDDAAMRSRLEKMLRELPGRSLLVVEHRDTQDLGDSWAGRARADRRTYGGTAVSFYE